MYTHDRCWAPPVPFLTWLKAPRPNKYLYRYFYPGHLAILAVIYTLSTGPIRPPADEPYYESDSYYHGGPNDMDFYFGDLPLYDMDEDEQ